ncbi:MAG: tetratricopeptide repeat protein [Gammaproteobacteria bacterium]|nr:MAG: tetratricopeptide repeat protein [Gammaproteobacteria bacterium]
MLTRFLAELRRRHVLNVAVVYVVIAWVIIQVVTAIFPPLHIPDWAQTFIVVLLIIGFPVALILAWAFDITPKGLVRDTADSAVAESSEIYRAGLDARKSLLITVLILAVGVGLWLFLPQPDTDWTGTEPVASSIAVLPFLDMSEAKDNEHFTDGLTEALLHDLANIPGLKVAARTSSFAFKNQDLDIRTIGETLGVATVLEGSVRKSGDDLKITAQLINVDDGYHLWSETYDARMDDIFAIQEQISRAIGEALKIRLLPDSSGLGGPSTKDAGAYGLYLQGVGSLRAAEIAEDFDEAIDLFNQALRRDPVFAEAEAGLCSAYWAKYESTKDTDLAESALNTCDRASVLDPDSVEVQIALGGLYTGTGRTDFAIETFNEAIRLAPDNDDAHRGLGIALEQARRWDEAEASFRKAIDLNPGHWDNHTSLAILFRRLGRLEDAIAAYQRSIDLNPDNPKSWSNLGGIHFMRGDFPQAAEAFSYSLAYNPTALGYSNAGTNYYYAGNFVKSREMFEKAVELSPHDFRLVGNLADACQVLEDCDAGVYYSQALGMANDQLQVDPSDAGVVALMAVYQAQLGNMEEAVRLIRRARGRDATNPDVLWNAGITYALVGDEQQAVRVLNAAVAAGYPRQLVAADPTLASLADRIATTH